MRLGNGKITAANRSNGNGISTKSLFHTHKKDEEKKKNIRIVIFLLKTLAWLNVVAFHLLGARSYYIFAFSQMRKIENGERERKRRRQEKGNEPMGFMAYG